MRRSWERCPAAGKQVISVGERCLLGANAGIGIALGDDCVVEAGLYVTAATKVTLPGGPMVKALELSGQDGLLFLRNSVTGAIEVRPRLGNPSSSTQRCTRTSRWRPYGAERWGACVIAVVLVAAPGSRRRSSWLRSRGLTTPVPGQQRCVATANGRSVALDLEQAHYASIIVGVSVKRGLPPRAATIALATVYQETGIRNLDYGDRDSVGLFQQRPSAGLGQPEAADRSVLRDGQVLRRTGQDRRLGDSGHHQGRTEGPEQQLSGGLSRSRG